jgi:integrase
VRHLGRSTLTQIIPSAVGNLYLHSSRAGIAKHSLVKAVKKVCLRETPPPKGKLPGTVGHLKAMIPLVNRDERDIRDMFMLILMFLGFLRESEIVALEFEDIWVGDLEGTEVLYVYISPMSKNDTERTGHTVVLVEAPESPLCPVSWFRLHCKTRRSATHVFHSSFLEPKKLSPKTPNSIFKRWLKAIGVDPRPYGSHSLRRGGVSAAAAAGIRTHVLKRHGRWKSDAVYLYIVDPTTQVLSVTKTLLSL